MARMGRPRTYRHRMGVRIYLDQDEHRAGTAWARRTGIPLAAWIRQVVAEALARDAAPVSEPHAARGRDAVDARRDPPDDRPPGARAGRALLSPVRPPHAARIQVGRSEEHTSELQSLRHLV